METDHDFGCLTLDVRAGEVVVLDGGAITIDVLEKSGRTARLRVHAPRSMMIEKKETVEPSR